MRYVRRPSGAKARGCLKFLGSIVIIVHTGYKGIFKGFLIDGTRASVTIEIYM